MGSESIAHEAFVNYHFHAARRSRRVAFQSLRHFLPEDNQIIASVWLLFTADKKLVIISTAIDVFHLHVRFKK